MFLAPRYLWHILHIYCKEVTSSSKLVFFSMEEVVCRCKSFSIGLPTPSGSRCSVISLCSHACGDRFTPPPALLVVTGSVHVCHANFVWLYFMSSNGLTLRCVLSENSLVFHRNTTRKRENSVSSGSGSRDVSGSTHELTYMLNKG